MASTMVKTCKTFCVVALETLYAGCLYSAITLRTNRQYAWDFGNIWLAKRDPKYIHVLDMFPVGSALMGDAAAFHQFIPRWVLRLRTIWKQLLLSAVVGTGLAVCMDAVKCLLHVLESM